MCRILSKYVQCILAVEQNMMRGTPSVRVEAGVGRIWLLPTDAGSATLTSLNHLSKASLAESVFGAPTRCSVWRI